MSSGPSASLRRVRDSDRADAAREQARAKSLLQPLRRLATDFRDRVRAGLHARGHDALQPTHSSVIVHLDTSGMRLTELAERCDVSKQAMGKLVAELEAIGYVEVAADPADARAKIVRFSRKGRALLTDSAEVVDGIWDHYAGLIGERRLVTLRTTLSTLIDRVDADR
jgi:DNA-binding MarR family transcriptional regulator